ncbi:uncharacterized protein LOC119242943 [Talpa occidentalis]|uniref:uncharacterized protein LOC119242943 n=1 Tax=Talpa occidentalis TaxID=50954 RepID=UPI00189085DB|nr:uncharacterized protein LOC119242943 [Talpa occidentalis]
MSSQKCAFRGSSHATKTARGVFLTCQESPRTLRLSAVKLSDCRLLHNSDAFAHPAVLPGAFDPISVLIYTMTQPVDGGTPTGQIQLPTRFDLSPRLLTRKRTLGLLSWEPGAHVERLARIHILAKFSHTKGPAREKRKDESGSRRDFKGRAAARALRRLTTAQRTVDTPHATHLEHQPLRTRSGALADFIGAREARAQRLAERRADGPSSARGTPLRATSGPALSARRPGGAGAGWSRRGRA